MKPEAASPTQRPGPLSRLKAHLLHPELTPERIAWSFAVGLAVAWNPLLGTHTALIILLCMLVRHFHRPLMLLACFINNPWTAVPMATFSTYLGNILIGRGLSIDFGAVHWNEVGWRSFLTREGLSATCTMLKPVLVPYLLGGFVMTALAIPVGYGFMKWLTLRLRRVHWKDIHLPQLHLPHGHSLPTEPLEAPDPGGSESPKSKIENRPSDPSR